MTGKKEKTAVLFDVDDTLYDQTVPFMEAYAEFFGPDPDIPAEVIYPVTRKYSDQMFSRAMSGDMSMDEMYIYRVQKAFEEFEIPISDEKALDFQRLYARRQDYIRMSRRREDLRAYCHGRAPLGILTNGTTARQCDKVKSLQAERWIPHENIFVSADVGAEKPDRKIFDHAKQAMNLDDGEIWFIGDAYPLDIAGAVNAGWNAVWMNRRRKKAPDDRTGQKNVVTVETEEELFRFIKKLLGNDM